MSYSEDHLIIGRYLRIWGNSRRYDADRHIATSNFGLVPRDTGRAAAVDSTSNARRFVRSGIYLMDMIGASLNILPSSAFGTRKLWTLNGQGIHISLLQNHTIDRQQPNRMCVNIHTCAIYQLITPNLRANLVQESRCSSLPRLEANTVVKAHQSPLLYLLLLQLRHLISRCQLQRTGDGEVARAVQSFQTST